MFATEETVETCADSYGLFESKGRLFRMNHQTGETWVASESLLEWLKVSDRPEAATAGDGRFEEARVRAYRRARLFEPNADLYAATMSVYEAAFGEHPGEVQIVK